MDKDKLGNELKIIMEGEVKGIELSQGLKDKILMNRKKTLRGKVRDFLNKEIELHLVPMVAGLMLVFVVVAIPRDLLKSNEDIRVIDIGSSQMIIRDGRRVSRNHED